jgi:hypothetical protein
MRNDKFITLISAAIKSRDRAAKNPISDTKAVFINIGFDNAEVSLPARAAPNEKSGQILSI